MADLRSRERSRHRSHGRTRSGSRHRRRHRSRQAGSRHSSGRRNERSPTRQFPEFVPAKAVPPRPPSSRRTPPPPPPVPNSERHAHKGHRHSYKRPLTTTRSPDPRRPVFDRQHPYGFQPGDRNQPKRADEPADENRRVEPADETNTSDDAWWVLYRQEYPDEDWLSLSKTQKTSRRRRFLRAVAAAEEQNGARPGVRDSIPAESGGGVSDGA